MTLREDLIAAAEHLDQYIADVCYAVRMEYSEAQAAAECDEMVQLAARLREHAAALEAP